MFFCFFLFVAGPDHLSDVALQTCGELWVQLSLICLLISKMAAKRCLSFSKEQGFQQNLSVFWKLETVTEPDKSTDFRGAGNCVL